jgi:hypothetical protein
MAPGTTGDTIKLKVKYAPPRVSQEMAVGRPSNFGWAPGRPALQR